MDRDELRLAQVRLALEVNRSGDLVRDAVSSSLVSFVWIASMVLLFAIWIPGVPWWVMLGTGPLIVLVIVDGYFQDRRWKRREERAERILKAAEDPEADLGAILRERD